MADLRERAYVSTSDGGSVAYQVSGAGPVDVLILPATGLPLDVLWEAPGLVRVRDRFDAFSRSVWLEPRGWGSSDRDVTPARSLEEEVTNEQLTAVADAVGSERFALLGFATLGPWALRYAAAHPERVSALVLVDTFASCVQDEECPWGYPIDFIEHQIAGIVAEMWGTGSQIDLAVPSRKDDDQLRDVFPVWGASRGDPCVRGGMGQGFILAGCARLPQLDSRPTLVLHRRNDALISVESGRYLAEHLDGAKYVELPGADTHFLCGDSDVVIDEIEEFLTGSRSGAEGDVVVATVLFTDIVDSTRQAATLGHPRGPPWPRSTIRESATRSRAIAGVRSRRWATGSSRPLTVQGADPLRGRHRDRRPWDRIGRTRRYSHRRRRVPRRRCDRPPRDDREAGLRPRRAWPGADD